MSIERMGSTARMSSIVKHNGTVYLCGQVSDKDGVEAQTKDILQKIEALLEQAGSSREQILSVTIYLRDIKDFAAMNAVYDAWVADIGKPARACVEARLAAPDLLVELSVIAAY